MPIDKWFFNEIIASYDSFNYISAEDPSENFLSLRDFVDCRRCATLPAFSTSNLHEGFSEDMANEARNKLKIHKVFTRT